MYNWSLSRVIYGIELYNYRNLGNKQDAMDIKGPGLDTMLGMDASNVEIAILTENLRSMSTISEEVTTGMSKLSTTNKAAIRHIGPLMNTLRELKIKQGNLHAVESKVAEIKEYAKNIRQLDELLDADLLDAGITGVKQFIETLRKLRAIGSDMKQQGLGGYKALNRQLVEGMLSGDTLLKSDVLKRVSQLNGKDTKNIEEIRVEYEYLTRERDIDIDEQIMRERIGLLKRKMGSCAISTPKVNNDQNYIYDGGNSESFPVYIDKIKGMLSNELYIVHNLFRGFISAELLGSYVNKYVSVVSFEIIGILNGIINFVEKRRTSYNTMYYELCDGANRFVGWLFEQHLVVDQTLQQLAAKCERDALNTFGEFFQYIRSKYEEMVVNVNSHETLNNTFMLISTRINNFSRLRDYQLQYISQITINEWLPVNLPNGFVAEKERSSDPLFLLGTFYSDAIEYSFYLLADKYRGKKADEEVGVILLFNLDGLQTLLEGKSLLKQILGQRGMDRYEKLKKKAMDRAVMQWSTLTARIMQASTLSGSNLSMSQKDLVKFIEEFNITFQELQTTFQRMDIPPYFRKQLVQDITKTLVPSYKIFHAYAGQTGGRSVAKHLTLTPSQLADELSKM